jgi:hypothetical protein
VETSLAEIESLASLPPGWDSYEADPVSPAARERARACVQAVFRTLARSYTKPAIGPTPSGVALVWRKEGWPEEVHVLLSSTDASYVVVRDRVLLEKGPITDYALFAREVLKYHQPL